MPWIECFWSMGAERALAVPVRPDGCVDIVYSRGSGLQAVGAMTASRVFELPQGSAMKGIRFRPGMAARFLKIPAWELTDRVTSLADILGRATRDLEERLAEGAPLADCLRLPGIPDSGLTPFERALRALAEGNGAVDLDRIAGQANLSPRQFRRRCLEAGGLSPKHLCRVLRFRKAFEAAGGTNEPNWASIAIDFGYFDQAHLIRDFREFTGSTPMAVFSNTAAALAD